MCTNRFIYRNIYLGILFVPIQLQITWPKLLVWYKLIQVGIQPSIITTTTIPSCRTHVQAIYHNAKLRQVERHIR